MGRRCEPDGDPVGAVAAGGFDANVDSAVVPGPGEVEADGRAQHALRPRKEEKEKRGKKSGEGWDTSQEEPRCGNGMGPHLVCQVHKACWQRC